MNLPVVTQLTSKTTAVTFNYKSGMINTVALTDAADTSFSFVVNNDLFYPDSNVTLTPIYAGTTGVVNVSIVSRGAFTFTIKVANVGVAVFNEAVGINVVINN